MPIELKMPALSPTMEEGTLAKWLVKEGDSVQSGDLLAEIETDKATMEFEAVDEGTIAQILVPEGADNVKVGTVIAVIAGEDEDAGSTKVTPAPAPAPPPRPTPRLLPRLHPRLHPLRRRPPPRPLPRRASGSKRARSPSASPPTRASISLR